MIYKKHRNLNFTKSSKELGAKNLLLQEFPDQGSGASGGKVSASTYEWSLENYKNGNFVTHSKTELPKKLNLIIKNFLKYEIKDGKTIESQPDEQSISAEEFEVLKAYTKKEMEKLKDKGVKIEYKNPSGTKDDNIIIEIDNLVYSIKAPFSDDIPKAKKTTSFNL